MFFSWNREGEGLAKQGCDVSVSAHWNDLSSAVLVACEPRDPGLCRRHG